ncbi:glycosyltransferase [Lutibacter profundi]|uniref:Glycosyltransferase n=1 Tax=Lutibacter profundi TaxID=1622118 RepID=A0A0X8G768_9FLAO|nr:glycosyltransferase [Lutibacter profundi]
MLVAPLNWGLGHATRCIPIINALIKAKYEPILASDGGALLLLQKEFPSLKSYVLPSYNIKYSNKGKNLLIKLFLSIPSVISAVKKERKTVNLLIETEGITGIISDNRFGVVSYKIPSVYITHQLRVLSGLTTFFTSKIHQKIIEQFNECWIPDIENKFNFSGDLGHIDNQNINIKYVGLLSRFKKENLAIKYDLLVLLSGPEPQRTLLEVKLLLELKSYKGNILFVRGTLLNLAKITKPANFKVINYLLSEELEEVINQSKVILARSGYSTIMDLAVLGKKAFFIPTPGQFEQEYLANILNQKLIAPFVTQEEFTIEHLKRLDEFSGFQLQKITFKLDFFKLFEGK